jgi:hypothetical protein
MNPDIELPDVLADAEEGFADLGLRLIRLEGTVDEGFLLEAWGQHQGRAVAFAAELEPAWDPQPLKDTSDYLYWGSVVLQSLGTASDALPEVLDLVYGTSLGPLRMRAATRWTAVGLATDPRRLREAGVKMKLFFEHEDEPRYAEIYFNIDPGGECVELHEKDEEYRRAALLALSGGAAEQ